MLQLAGEGLLLALAQGLREARELTRPNPGELQDRIWDGDDDRPAPILRPLPIDLEDLAVDTSKPPLPMEVAIDLHTGAVCPQTALTLRQSRE